jgi:hypothetical protein
VDVQLNGHKSHITHIKSMRMFTIRMTCDKLVHSFREHCMLLRTWSTYSTLYMGTRLRLRGIGNEVSTATIVWCRTTKLQSTVWRSNATPQGRRAPGTICSVELLEIHASIFALSPSHFFPVKFLGPFDFLDHTLCFLLFCYQFCLCSADHITRSFNLQFVPN